MADLLNGSLFSKSPPQLIRNFTSPTLAGELRGAFRCISTFLFFHLFDEEDQLKLAETCGELLSKTSGSMILGAHRMSTITGRVHDTSIGSIFCHSPDSWNELWREKVFPPGLGTEVRVDIDSDLQDPAHEIDGLICWTVTVI